MNLTGSSILISCLMVGVIIGYIVLAKVPGARKWLTPFARNWYALITMVIILSMCLGMNIAQTRESWITFVVGVIVMIVLFSDIFSVGTSIRRQLILIILTIGFVVGASVIAIDEDYDWVGYLIFMLLAAVVIIYFVTVKKFKQNIKFKELIRLIKSKTLFIYLILSLIVLSLIFQYSQFGSDMKLGSFTIILTLGFIGFFTYFVVKRPKKGGFLTPDSVPFSLKSL